VLTAVFAAGQQSMVVGIIEFEEKTSIGQENAGVIIPEILINDLKNIGRYKLAERVLLQTALEEQELQMTGITDQSSAAKVGQVFGLDAFVVGSVMKVDKKISITGRVIATETAEIITTGTVEFTNLKHLDAELEELAYQLSGYSESEYRKILFVKEISKNTIGALAGISVGYDIEFGLGFFPILDGSVFYNGRYLDFVFHGAFDFAPDDGYSSMFAILTGYPLAHIGIGAGWLFAEYTMPPDYKDQLGKEHYAYGYNALVFGISVRITENLRIAMYQGPALTGNIWYQSETVDSDQDTYEIKPKWFLVGGANVVSSVEYYFLDNWLVKFASLWQGAEADTGEFRRSQNMLFSLQVGYGYSF
jgi:hypothetical protein